MDLMGFVVLTSWISFMRSHILCVAWSKLPLSLR